MKLLIKPLFILIMGLLLGCSNHDPEYQDVDRKKVLQLAEQSFHDVTFSNLTRSPDFWAEFSEGTPFSAIWSVDPVTPTTETLTLNINGSEKVAYTRWHNNSETGNDFVLIRIPHIDETEMSVTFFVKFAGALAEDERTKRLNLIRTEIEAFLSKSPLTRS